VLTHRVLVVPCRRTREGGVLDEEIISGPGRCSDIINNTSLCFFCFLIHSLVKVLYCRKTNINNQISRF
jgi:hypothetical protein